jgi:hypothetical protein
MLAIVCASSVALVGICWSVLSPDSLASLTLARRRWLASLTSFWWRVVALQLFHLLDTLLKRLLLLPQIGLGRPQLVLHAFVELRLGSYTTCFSSGALLVISEVGSEERDVLVVGLIAAGFC